MKKVTLPLLFVMTLCIFTKQTFAQNEYAYFLSERVPSVTEEMTPEARAFIIAATTEVPVTDPNINAIDKFYCDQKTVAQMDTTTNTAFKMKCMTSANIKTKIVWITFCTATNGEYFEKNNIMFIQKPGETLWRTARKYPNHEMFVSEMLKNTVAFIGN